MDITYNKLINEKEKYLKFLNDIHTKLNELINDKNEYDQLNLNELIDTYISLKKIHENYTNMLDDLKLKRDKYVDKTNAYTINELECIREIDTIINSSLKELSTIDKHLNIIEHTIVEKYIYNIKKEFTTIVKHKGKHLYLHIKDGRIIAVRYVKSYE